MLTVGVWAAVGAGTWGSEGSRNALAPSFVLTLQQAGFWQEQAPVLVDNHFGFTHPFLLLLPLYCPVS